MITMEDLEEAIAECQGQRNPNASTCIKLAAYLTIKQALFGEEEEPQKPSYSYAVEPKTYESDTEFAQLANKIDYEDLMAVMDELMEVLKATQPRLYAGVLRKMQE